MQIYISHCLNELAAFNNVSISTMTLCCAFHPPTMLHFISFISGTCQQFTHSYTPKGTYSCPGSNIAYTCVLCSSFAGVTTVWRGSAFNCSSTENHAANQLSLFQKSGGVVNQTAFGSCGNLSAVYLSVQ